MGQNPAADLDVQTLQHRDAEGGGFPRPGLRPAQSGEGVSHHDDGRAGDELGGLLSDDVTAFNDLFDGSLLDGRRLLEAWNTEPGQNQNQNRNQYQN